MGYDYTTERPRLFTEDGQVLFLKIRDTVQRLLTEAGAFTADKAMAGCSGDSWKMLAALDRLVELDEIYELTTPGSTWAQHRVFSQRYTP